MTVLIIGAGMAGLSAGYHLSQAGESPAILEARDRIGGRVYTNRTFCDIPVEFGAEFVHGDSVPTWEHIRAMNLQTLHWKKDIDSMVRMENGDWLTMAMARGSYLDFDLTRTWHLPDTPVADGDESFADYLRRVGFSDEQLQYVRRSYANAVADIPEVLSAAESVETLLATRANGGDYRILDGYDRLVTELARGLDIQLHTIVTHIAWREQGVTVTTQSGESFHADRAIITLPLGVLQSGTITFDPPLPQSKLDAMAKLRMGPVLKLIYRFDEPIMDDDSIMAVYSNLNPPMWWSPSFGHKTDEHIWTAFVSGDWARDLLAMGADATLRQGLHSLQMELDRPDLTPVASHLVNWPADPFAYGGYSVALVGGAGARAQLAQPTPPLFWAGEATAPNASAATVHGAYISGKRAAQEVRATL